MPIEGKDQPTDNEPVRIRALDGLRGVAILLVVVFHSWPQFLQAGGYGVTVFFVLSGFLITGLLIRDEKIAYGRFYWNRAVRLFPALFVVLAACVFMFGRWEPVAWVAGYAANIGALLDGDLSRLAHAWSLAVEEHFYLVWPLVIGLLPRAWRWRGGLLILGVALVWRIFMSATSDDFWRVMIGTDTSVYALLAGCVLAIAHYEHRFEPPSPGVTVGATLGVIAASFIIPNPTYAFLWGDLAVVGLAAIAVAGCLRPVPLLENPALVWFGTISYGLYLWHFPVLHSGWLHPAVALTVSILLAWASFRYVERPMRARWHKSTPERTVRQAQSVGS